MDLALMYLGIFVILLIPTIRVWAENDSIHIIWGSDSVGRVLQE